MEQLTGTDSLFLYQERGNNYIHVAALTIYDPAAADGGRVRFPDVLVHLRARLSDNPIFRRRLAPVPYGLDRPYWIDDPEIDVEYHIRRCALQKPGDWPQLMAEVARLHSRPLDRRHPLWEIHVIEGLDGVVGLPRGAFALFMKFHHASADGLAAIEVAKSLHAATPNEQRAAARPQKVVRELLPSDAQMVAQAVVHGVDRALDLSRFSLRTVRKLRDVALAGMTRQLDLSATGGGKARALPSFAKAPVTRFNHPISTHRVVEAVGWPQDALKAIRTRVGGVTMNDIFLAVVGGALRRYLASKDDLPARSLVALMPISLRGRGAAGANNVSGVPVALRTDIADPIARLSAVRRAVQEANEEAKILGHDFAQAAFESLPHRVTDLVMRRVLLPQLNVTVSNVRGPTAPLYLAGARLIRLYPVSLPADYVGLNHTGVSYDGVLWVSAVACRNMMPDPGYYALCLRESFDELIAATEGMPARTRSRLP